jgi:transposase
MTKHSEQFKLSLIKRYLRGEGGYRTLANRFDVNRQSIQKWVAAYRLHGVVGLRAKRSYYDAAFKLSVLKHMHRKGLSYGETAVAFDIRSMATVGHWARQYDEGGIEALTPTRQEEQMSKIPNTLRVPPDVALEDTRTLKEVLEENAYLRMENAYLKKRKALIQAEQLAAQNKKRKSSLG